MTFYIVVYAPAHDNEYVMGKDTPLEEWICALTAETWVRRYPEDIVMLVEEDA